MLGLGLPAQAGCRIALALAIDVSRSVDAADYVIQTEGLMAALADAQVQAAFLNAADHVSLAVYQWSGRSHQEMIADWTAIRSSADLAGVSALIGAHQRPARSLPTALGRALDYGRQVMETAPDCTVRVLDVAGDGQNNEGMSPADAYARRDFGDLIVNGLAIGEHETDVVLYYRTQVIRGPGAFVEVAPRQSDYPAAIRRKLIRELSVQVLGAGAPTSRRGG